MVAIIIITVLVFGLQVEGFEAVPSTALQMILVFVLLKIQLRYMTYTQRFCTC